MQNPLNYFKECFQKVKAIDNDIASKKEEIKRSQNRLDEIEYEKDSTSFKWYDIKDKTDFNNNLKAEKKSLKALISKKEKEIQELEKQREKAKSKTENLILWFCIAMFFVFAAVAVTVGSINEKNNPKPEYENTTIVEITQEAETTQEIEKTEETEETKEIETTETTAVEKTTELDATKQNTTIQTTAERTTEPTTSRSQKIVYGSKTGNHYHNGSCRYANGQELTIEQAERKGWDACAVCNP